MNANEPGPARPAPKPPATGADAWRNTPTSCWPTPAAMERSKKLTTPLDPDYEPDAGAPADESAWESEGGAEDDDPDSRSALRTDEGVPQRFRETVGRLDEVPDRPVADHAESYDAVHRDLRRALDDIERPS